MIRIQLACDACGRLSTHHTTLGARPATAPRDHRVSPLSSGWATNRVAWKNCGPDRRCERHPGPHHQRLNGVTDG